MTARWPIVALAIGTFSIGVTEFTPMGLLPVIAQGVGASIPSVGLLISAYATGVMIGAPLMALALGRLRQKHALLILMAIFTVGNILAAAAPGYATLFGARVLTSLAHGAFFGIGSVVAASLVAPEKRASAVAAMLMGLTIANIGGVPAATWIGQQIGWRAAFVVAAALGLVSIAALQIALPQCRPCGAPDWRREVGVLLRPSVLSALSITVLSSGAMFTLYTYVAPILETLTGATPSFVTMALVVIGIGFTVGNALGGRFADRSLRGSLMVCFGTLAVIMLVFPLVASTGIGAMAMLLLWGTATFAAVPPIQMQVMGEAADAPGLAASVNIGAFNLGNALGAAIGGAVISLGLGLRSVPVAGALLAVAALAVTVLRKGEPRPLGDARRQPDSPIGSLELRAGK